MMTADEVKDIFIAILSGVCAGLFLVLYWDDIKEWIGSKF